MRLINVWVENWQMQCCGTPFSVADVVTWQVMEFDPDVLHIENSIKIDYLYEAHGSLKCNLIEVKGTVLSIYKVYQKYALKYDKKYKRDVYIPVAEKLEKSATQATGWEDNQGEYKFSAYVVLLEIL